MGCLVERYRDELAQGIPEVAGWFGLVGRARSSRRWYALLGGDGGQRPGRRRQASRSARTSYAYVKISDGCDELCTLLRHPRDQGRRITQPRPPRSWRRPTPASTAGAKELVLVGQDTARWESGGLDLVGLAETLAADPRLSWLRVMYLQPEHVERRASWSTWGRAASSAPTSTCLCSIRIRTCCGAWAAPETATPTWNCWRGPGASVPGVAVRSAFIVGFPGETEAHFEHLLDFVREAEFDYAGGFIYSPEEGTPAARLRPAVPRRVARERLNRLNRVLAEVAEAIHGRQVGDDGGRHDRRDWRAKMTRRARRPSGGREGRRPRSTGWCTSRDACRTG